CNVRGRSAEAGSPKALKVGFSRFALTLPLVISRRCRAWPLVPTKVPFGLMQPVQLKNVEVGRTASPLGSDGSGPKEGLNAVSTSLVLEERKFAVLKTLNASNRSSTLTLSALGIAKVLCNEASNLTKFEPRPASRPTLPLTWRKSTIEF